MNSEVRQANPMKLICRILWMYFNVRKSQFQKQEIITPVLECIISQNRNRFRTSQLFGNVRFSKIFFFKLCIDDKRKHTYWHLFEIRRLLVITDKKLIKSKVEECTNQSKTATSDLKKNILSTNISKIILFMIYFH